MQCGTAIVTEQLLDEQQALKFESLCVDAGARFIGGVMAALGFAERELTGTDTYYGITPSDAREEADMFTTGWFTGLVPITAPVDGTFAAARSRHRNPSTGADSWSTSRSTESWNWCRS